MSTLTPPMSPSASARRPTAVHVPSPVTTDVTTADVATLDAPPDASLDGLRRRVSALAMSDRLEKDEALQITRLFHAMEVLHNTVVHERDAQIASLRAELERMRLQVELDRLACRQVRDDAALVTPQVRTSSVRRR